MSKKRMPMQVSEEFERKLKELQKRIMMMTGEKTSLRDLTENLTQTPAFSEVENRILKNKNINLNIRIKMDGRRIYNE